MQKWIAVGVQRYTDLVVWQLAEEFKRNTFGLVRASAQGETEGCLRDGIARGFFAEADCATQFTLAKRLSKGITRLKATQLRYAAELEARKKQAKARKLREPYEEN